MAPITTTTTTTTTTSTTTTTTRLPPRAPLIIQQELSERTIQHSRARALALARSRDDPFSDGRTLPLRGGGDG
ncbi:hypothetical protein PTT_07933 [Pyrenophora teres f. teres 0-1]|uniref:Uncharacterized protein n=1 Tax=Pyrenophora teres f. teres (strain 0-1) TaxID=861557 RepID=E3RIQ2_PYRTT|nr:hypothetical protein PTT_07933 [Pyrenophora teres f. teres 0-1]